jgi:hypothetical protein
VTNAGFVAAMEDVLDTYQKPRDSDRPLVCLDESSKQGLFVFAGWLIATSCAIMPPIEAPTS